MATENLSDYTKPNLKHAGDLSIGIIVSDWNSFATHGMLQGAKDTLIREGVSEYNIKVIHVPGAFELSYASAQACKKGAYDAIIAIGSVIRGETAHFDYVCSGVTQGITQCNLNYDTPVIFCVLTDDTKEQSIARSGGSLGNKGVEAAATALHMCGLDF